MPRPQEARKMCLACNREFVGDEQFCPNDFTALILIGSSDPFVGTTVNGKYLIEEVIGKGGNAVVYAAKYNDETVALRLSQVQRNINNVIWQGMQRRIKAMQGLVHPNINRVRDFAMLPNQQIMLVCNYLEGDSLLDFLRRRTKLSLTDAYPIFAEVCNGLEYAHAADVMHCDLKPSNIMITTSGVRLIDFEYQVTYMTDQCQTCCQEIGQGLNIIYSSPEFVMARPITPSSDLYSLACCLFEALAGKPPFRGTNFLQTASHHLSHPPPPAGTPELDAFFAIALAKKPENRFQTASEFKNALARML